MVLLPEQQREAARGAFADGRGLRGRRRADHRPRIALEHDGDLPARLAAAQRQDGLQGVQGAEQHGGGGRCLVGRGGRAGTLDGQPGIEDLGKEGGISCKCVQAIGEDIYGTMWNICCTTLAQSKQKY